MNSIVGGIGLAFWLTAQTSLAPAPPPAVVSRPTPGYRVATQNVMPIAPTQPIRPKSWPTGGPPEAAGSTVDAKSPPGEVVFGKSVLGGIPEEFTGAEVVARVGSQYVLAYEVLTGVEENLQRLEESGQITKSQIPQARQMLMRKNLQPFLDTKMVLSEALREMPKDNLSKIEKKVREIYEREQVPKLMEHLKLKSRSELLEAFRKGGTTYEAQVQNFYERSMAQQWVHQKVGEEKEVTRTDMLAYYQDHVADFETLPRARWEHLMVRASHYKTKGEAYEKIAAWGNEVQGGAPFADVARKHSDDLSSEQGGLHAWTTQGSLASEVIDRAIFSLPVGQLSAILEDDRGFHIVRVVEREALQRKTFAEVQAEIKKRMEKERENVKIKAYVEKLRQRTPVWTIFDQQGALGASSAPSRLE